MGCGTSVNSVVPLQYFENQNGSALRINCPGSDILDYVSTEEIKEADERAEQLNLSETSIDILLENLCQNTKNKVICVRLFFKWIVNNIRYDPTSKYTDVNSILNNKRGSSEGFANLFEHMCSFKNIKVIRLNSCVKSYSFILDNKKLTTNIICTCGMLFSLTIFIITWTARGLRFQLVTRNMVTHILKVQNSFFLHLQMLLEISVDKNQLN
ncbi:unnamed protein product [Mytilus coruscus]|uniref:Transglutaminase-like domain-containing protein n=1 Tax=Mytilus coruscus TaxID=42192 RepID=A0A6J8B378_MYTCO|nr:unnamed protein product [Mytilus coruscus]